MTKYLGGPLEYCKKISLFSFYSQNERSEFQYSLSPLKIGEMYLKFLFLFSKVENILSDLSVSSRNWGKGMHVCMMHKCMMQGLFLADE